MEKKHLVSELPSSSCAEESFAPYTMEELRRRLDESERDFEAGQCYTTEEVLKMCGIEQMQLAAV